MNHSHIDTFINENDYSAIISIGNKCPTSMILSYMGCYRQSFPFDYIPTTPALILKYIKDQTDFYPERDAVLNKDLVWFGHFDTMDGYDITINEFKESFSSLFKLLEEKKRVLFVYTTEADVYNEFNCRYNDNYTDLKKLRDYIIEKYNYSDFTILAIHTNKIFESEPNFIHYTINIDEKYMSDNGETHIPEVFNPYRNVLLLTLFKIFRKF
jgi:hypothetical protein